METTIFQISDSKNLRISFVQIQENFTFWSAIYWIRHFEFWNFNYRFTVSDLKTFNKTWIRC